MKRTTILLIAGAIVTSAGAQDALLPKDYFFQPLPELKLPVGLDVLFGPRDNLEARIVRAIDSAKEEVLVNHYAATNEPILDALQRAFDRKCVVIVLLDEHPAIRDYRGFDELRARRIPAVAIRAANNRSNNSNYILIDRMTVIAGSPTLTNASGSNNETLFVISEPSVVISFYNHFVATAFPGRKRL